MPNMTLQPSQEQKEIIDSGKNTLVVSNPGTGKTTTLSLKVIKLLENGVKPENILCITFTEKAKKEMYDKILEMRGKFTVADVMNLNIHTFHSFAYHYLVDSGQISGDMVGNNALRYSILRSFEKNKVFAYPKQYIIDTMVPKTENAIRYIKSFGITPDKIDLKSVNVLVEKMYDAINTSYALDEVKAYLKYLVEAYKNYEDSKNDTVDFSDMLLMFVDKFKGKKYDYVLVDEMQDMNDLQARIAQMVGNTIFLVGDAKQAIFGFQGGSIKNFQKFKKTCDEKLLSLNRRSCQEILDYAKKHFLDGTINKKLFERELESFKSNTNGLMPKVISTDAPLSWILKIIEENPGKSIGVITRINKQIMKISQYLDANGKKYSSTVSQATTQKAKMELLGFLRGLFSERIEDKIAATFTVFSPYTIKEAFELSEMYDNKVKGEELKKLESWGISMRKDDIDKLFSSVIFPICVSKGAEWFSTAVTVQQQIDEYFSLELPTREGLFDFIEIAEESYIGRDVESGITLTSVHKAKGRDFDIVVYVPASREEKTSFVNIITESILESNGIDIKEELEEESLRVDFVAFTRAKETLIILADDKNARSYHIENLSELEIDDHEDKLVATRLDNRMTEAYSLFLAGRFGDSEKLLKTEDGWLEEFIINYFKNLEHLSYTSVETDPYKFLEKNIISIPFYSGSTDFGHTVHKALAKISKKKATIDDFEDDVQRAIQNWNKAIDQLKSEFPGLEFVDAEISKELPVSSMISYHDKTLNFKGYLDAVFKHNDGYIIVDYKTDKDTKRASKHKQQLAVYRKMYSILENIPEDKIKIFVVFIAIRGAINTGKFDWELEKENKNAFPTFEKHLRTVLEWRDDPKKFIQDLLDKPVDVLLYQTVKEKLLQSKPKI